MDIYRACYGLYSLNFLVLGIKPIASCMPGTALPLSHPTSGDRVLLSCPKLILNLLCSPRVLQRVVMLQTSRNVTAGPVTGPAWFYSHPVPSFHYTGCCTSKLILLEEGTGKSVPEPLLVQPEFACVKCLPSHENSAMRSGFYFSFTDHRTSFLKIQSPFQ